MRYDINGLILLSSFLFAALTSVAQVASTDAYRVETITMPAGLTAETGALEFLPDGRLVAGFTRGEIMIYNPVSKKWSLFAESFHDPLGILVISNNEMLVMHRPELTRIKDTDGNGSADLYQNVTDDFGISGNYHEFNYGPVKDRLGNLFVALNASSPAGSMRKEVRGEIKLLGRDGNGNSQMFSAVPYRGWVMRLSGDGKLLPFASGFRSPNGLGFDLAGNLFVTDNQGDWVGTSALYHVEEGKFYGHPASLVWQSGWNLGNPFHLPVKQLDSLRTRAAVLFPHGIIANSPSQPVVDENKGKFGPFHGQLFIGEMNEGKIVRVMLEKVNGQFQGACIPFFDGRGLRKGNNRLAFAPDGSLWVGQNAHGWLGDQGIQRIVYTGKTPFDILTMKLTKQGFDLTFTQPLDITDLKDTANYLFTHYYYAYHKKYGSDQLDKRPVAVTAVDVSADRKSISLSLDALKPGYVYELRLRNIISENGRKLENEIICYTLNTVL